MASAGAVVMLSIVSSSVSRLEDIHRSFRLPSGPQIYVLGHDRKAQEALQVARHFDEAFDAASTRYQR
jgi:hypothetical protein